jgi:hypothetical protein
VAAIKTICDVIPLIGDPETFDVVLTVHRRYYVEIKGQLDATDEFLLQILVFAQHVSGTIMLIIRSSRVLYKWLLPVVFSAWFSSCRYGVELGVVCPVLL